MTTANGNALRREGRYRCHRRTRGRSSHLELRPVCISRDLRSCHAYATPKLGICCGVCQSLPHERLSPPIATGLGRLKGYKDALAAAQLSMPDSYVVSTRRCYRV